MGGRLFYAGNAVVDIVLAVPSLPERGGDVLATGTEVTPGGGFNVMAAAARQGLPVVYAGAHGTGPFGDRVRAAMRDEGIALLSPAKPGLDTGFVVTAVDAEGERTFLTSPGAEATLTAEDLGALRPGAGDIVTVSGYGMLHPGNREALTARLPQLDDDVLLVVDPGPLVEVIPPDARRLLLARADWWTCNAREASAVTGLSDPFAAAGALAEITGRRGVLVRTGPDGCVVVRRGVAPVRVPGFAVRAVDMNGAGDAHTGIFIAAIATGVNPVEAARTANAGAALAVTARGPATAPAAGRLARFLSEPAASPNS
jgi:sugar/nucleoside kinase (ribokinase family)